MGHVARVLLSFLAVSLVAQDRLTLQEERGRQIFENGTSPSGTPIEAAMAGGDRLPASILPCANCHGSDGKGKAESSVVPSNLGWAALTKPYGISHPDGRTHPPYTERLLTRAITMGIDPAGNTLSKAMPRFQLSMADAADLVAYIKKLGQQIDPGLTGTTVRVGVILPAASQTNTSRIMRRALVDCFDRVNAGGGIFGRRIELIFTEIPLDGARRSEAILDFVQKEGVFTVVGADLDGVEAGFAQAMLDTQTPAIASVPPFSQTDSPFNKFVFYLDGGFKDEIDALLGFARERFEAKERRTVIVHSDDENSRKAAKWLEAQLAESKPFGLVVSEDMKPLLAGDLVFWLQPVLHIPSIATHGSTETVFLIPGSLARTAITTPSKSQVFVALGPAWRAETAPTDSAVVDHMTWDRASASAEIIVEAMTRAGRNLTRDALMQALEGFRKVRTSLPESISFGPTLRVGASHVRIVMIDP